MTPIARHGRLPRPRALTTVLGLIGGTLAVLLVSTLGVVGISAYQLASNLGPGVDLAPPGQTPPTLGAIDGPVNILLVGSDSGDGNKAYGNRGETLNDVTILLHISPKSHTATAISFPRDLLIPIPSCPKVDNSGYYSGMSAQKLNVSLSYGGLRCTVLTIEKLTGLTIPYAAKIEFDGVIAMSNAIGGVTVCLARPIDDPQSVIKLSAGTHTLKGWSALQFLRSRHGVGDGSDLNRISSQQVFLSSLMRKIKSEQVLTNPITLFSIAQAATKNMQLSTSLNHADTMMSMALALRDIPLSSVNFVQYPTVYTSDFLNVLPRTADAAILINAIAKDLPIKVHGVGAGAVGGADVTESPSPTDSAAPSTTPSSAPTDVVKLPATITGQSASEQSCSAGGGRN